MSKQRSRIRVGTGLVAAALVVVGMVIVNTGVAFANPGISSHLGNVSPGQRVSAPGVHSGNGARSTIPASTPTDPVTSTTAPGAGSGGGGTTSNPVCARFSTLQQLLESELAARAAQITVLTARVNAANASYLGDDKATLLGLLSATLTGIQGLEPVVQADTTCAELKTAAHAMVYDYRVYRVLSLQVDLTIAVDTETGISSTIEGLYPSIESEISAAQSSGNPNVAAAQAAFSDLQNQVSAALGAVSGLSAELLAQSPADAPGDSGVFSAARGAVESARSDLEVARGDLGEIQKDLGSPSTTSTTNA
jgi:hypothetical protein